MGTKVDEIADGIYRISTFVPEAAMTFNQYVIDAEEPLLFHCGTRALFPGVSAAVARVLAPDRLRWIGFGHFEADECGSLNHWLDIAPYAKVAFGFLGCLVSVNDFADRPPHALNDGDTLDLGGKRVRYLATPHVPHGWDAGILYEETTRTLLCGDLFTAMGEAPAITNDSPLAAAVAAEDAFGYSCLGPATAPTVRRLAELNPARLALMHGSTHEGDARAWLEALADDYAQRAARG